MADLDLLSRELGFEPAKPDELKPSRDGQDRAARAKQRRESRERIESGSDKAFPKPPTRESAEPGWFEPGSKSEAFTRGFSQAATLGFGDEIQAGIRSLTSDQTYRQLRDDERVANQAASDTNPGSYGAGTVTALAPMVAATGGAAVAPTVIRSAATGAGLGAVNAAGSSTGETAGEVAQDAAMGAALGGAVGGFASAPTLRLAKYGATRLLGGYAPLLSRALSAGQPMPATQRLLDRLTARLGARPNPPLLDYGPATAVERVVRGAVGAKNMAQNSAKVVGATAAGAVVGEQAVHGDGEPVSTAPTGTEARQGQPSQPSQPSLDDLSAELGFGRKTETPQRSNVDDLSRDLGFGAPAKPDYLSKVERVESSGDANAKSATSSASGLYQFTDGTWRDIVKRHGSKHGVTIDMKSDPEAQRAMARYLTQENEAALAAAAVPITDATRYIAHFLGAGGAKAFFDSAPTAAAASVLPQAAKANRAVFFHRNGSPKTVQEVFAWAESKVA